MKKMSPFFWQMDIPRKEKIPFFMDNTRLLYNTDHMLDIIFEGILLTFWGVLLTLILMAIYVPWQAKKYKQWDEIKR